MTQADIGLVATHNIGLVVLSVVIAIIASYTALNLAGRVTVAQGHTRILLWLTGGAIAMGVGIWSMHFIAMLAYNLPIPINYNLPIVLISMIVAIIASGVALFVVSRPSMNRLQLLTGGVFLGLGVAAMHYTGMAAMQLEATPVYNPQLVTLSIGIAIAASLIAMQLAFDLRADATSVSAWKLGSAIIMGNAIAGMHYTAMAAVNFYPKQVVTQSSSSIDTYLLGIGIGIATLIILTLALTTSVFEQRISVETAKAEVLRQSEERFRSLVQNASDIIVVVAADGTVNYASPTIKSILGYEPDTGKNALEFIHPDDITKAESLLTKALHSDSVNIAAQFRLKHADGQTRDFEVIANNLLNEPGVAGILTTYRDITQRKQAEVALQQQTQRERLVAEIAQRIRSSLNLKEILSTTVAEVRQFLQTERVFIYRFEPDWSGVVVVESVAPGWLSLSGMKVKDTFFEEAANRELYKQGRVEATEDIYTANLSQCHIDFLTTLQVRANLVVPILQEQQLWGLLVANHCSEPRQWQQLEINLLKQLAIQVAIAIQQSTLFQQVQTELSERQRTEAALRESEEKFRSLVEQTNDWIWKIDINCVFTYVSPQVRQILGYEPAEILGKTTFDLMAVDVDEVKRFAEIFESFISVQKPFICLEKTLIHKDGHPVVLETSGSPIFDCQQVFQGYRGIARDITERHQAEAQIKKLNADLQHRATELEAANKELEAFSYSVSHDLRAPLRAINGFSRILSNEYAPQIPPEARRYLQMVQDNAQQMGCLVDDLLAFSRLSRSPLNKQAVAPNNIVRQVFTDLSHDQENRHIEIAIDELPECHADPALLKQVWINLIANALKYTRQREVTCIQVGCQFLSTKRVYFVKDNGVGFDMRYAHKLFGVFQRLHRTEDYEGTGVGLAIVQRIIHRHGGSVWAEAEINKGATFYFSLEENYDDDRDGGRNPLSGGQSLRRRVDAALLEKQ